MATPGLVWTDDRPRDLSGDLWCWSAFDLLNGEWGGGGAIGP